MFSPSALRGVVLAILLAPAICSVQAGSTVAAVTGETAPATAPPPADAVAQATAPSAPPEMSASTRAAVNQRIRTLQSQLGVTEAQMPLWVAFAQTMRDNAASTDALFSQRAGAVSEMNAVDNMHSYAQIARAYADNTEHLATAFDSLYASLSDIQKRTADTLFRQQAIAAVKAQPRH